MSKIAIDVVLLPEQKMFDKVIKMNKELLKKHPNKIILGNLVNQPHISLCMGAIEKAELPKIIKSIEAIAYTFTSFDLQGKISVQDAPDRDSVTWLEIDLDERIQKLQNLIMKDLWKFLNYDIEEHMFADSHEIEERTVLYVKHYSKFYENPSLFRPHITIGYGSSLKNDKTFYFSSSKLALFKLGNHCTCKELIYETSLN